MKPTKVKAWPELNDYFPSVPLYPESRGAADSAQPAVEIDFGSVRTVSSTGLTIFLLRLLRVLGERKNPNIRHECAEGVREKLKRLGALEILGKLGGSMQTELPIVEGGARFEEGRDGYASLPVYRLGFEGCIDRRRPVREFVSWLSRGLATLAEDHGLEANGLAMLINEMAKNTADHAGSDALFGLDAGQVDEGKSRLTFAFGDLGMGIKQHIEQHLTSEEEKRRKHMSLYEAYRLALKQGYTSNRSSRKNRGYGMSIIIDCAAALKMHLSIFDAKSRGLLSSLEDGVAPSHSAVRRIFHNMGHEVGFFYYGELILRIR